jgi:hypothetical protein
MYNISNVIVPGVGTKIEPTLCRADRLVGQVLGAVGALPKIFIELEISYYLLKRLLGVRTEGDKKGARVLPPFCAVWILMAKYIIVLSSSTKTVACFGIFGDWHHME